MKWFKHDADASIDAKLQELLLDYGAAGYGLYWYCVELIAQGVDKNNITFELEHDARIIAKNLQLSTTNTLNMMKKMIELGLFSVNSNSKLACYSLAKRIDQSMTSNPEFRALISEMREKNDEVMISHDLVMQDKKRIDKSRKEYKRREFVKPNIEDIKNYISENNFEVDPYSFYEYYENTNWHTAKNTPVKNWKLTLRQWNLRSNDSSHKNNDTGIVGLA